VHWYQQGAAEGIVRFESEEAAAAGVARGEADGTLPIGDDKLPAKIALITGDAEQELIDKVSKLAAITYSQIVKNKQPIRKLPERPSL